MKIVYVGGVVAPNDFTKYSTITPSNNNIENKLVFILNTKYKNDLLVVSQTCIYDCEGNTLATKKKQLEFGKEILIVPHKEKSIKSFSLLISLYKEINNIRKSNKDENIIFIIYNPYSLRVLPVYLANRKQNKIIIFQTEPVDLSKIKLNSNPLDHLIFLLSAWLMRHVNGIITTCLNATIPLAPKTPYLFFHLCPNLDFIDTESIKKKPLTKNEKTILYSGSLFSLYGIDLILKSFLYLPQNYKLQLCGRGDVETIAKIKEMSTHDLRIKYLGFLPFQEVAKLQKNADLLLLIRKSENKRDKYLAENAIPSKMNEYLSSGTPILATKIKAIPNEYDNYINYTSNNSIMISQNIKQIVENVNGFYIKKAKEGQKFIISNCTWEIQEEKILSFIEGTIKQ